jgi:hypothetical protein
MAVEIIPVETRAELKRFIRLPMRLSKKDPSWVAPLLIERLDALSKTVNPFFQHADVQFWLARKDGRDVGRISAQIDHLAKTDPAAPVGNFGMIAAEDDPEVFDVLFRTAEDWLRARGRAVSMGPFNLSINEEVGLLIDGFDTPPMFMMGHDQPYTATRIEALGYAKAKDVFAYLSDEFAFSRRVEERINRPLPAGVSLRPVRMKDFDREVVAMVEILNDAWSENWGATPVTEAETKHLANSLKLILIPDWIWFMDIDGETAAFIVLLPNLNEIIRDLDGKLFPFGWAKLIWRLKFQPVRSGRVPLMGVKKKFARDRRGMMAPFLLIDAIRRTALTRGLTRAEYSWILEDNRPMRHILDGLSARVYKTYRIYQKQITPNPTAPP